MTFTVIVELAYDIEEAVNEDEELNESNFERLDENDDIQIGCSKFYKNSEKYEKFYRLAIKKLIKVEIERENLSTKFDEGNWTIWALRFENSFLTEKTKKLDAELHQVKAKLEHTSSANLDEMLSTQKSSYVKTGLGYVTSFSSCANSNSACHIIIFVSPCDDTKIENNASKMELESEVKHDKKKFILGAPLKLLKKKENRILNLSLLHQQEELIEEDSLLSSLWSC